MAAPSVAHKLANVPIFSGCSKRELGIIARASKEVSHKEGTVIAREGERGIGLFLILDGECKVSIGGKTKARAGCRRLLRRGRAARRRSPHRDRDGALAGPPRRDHRLGLPRPADGASRSIALKTLEAVAGRLRSVSKEPV